MMMKGFLSQQEGVMDTGQKVGVVTGDGGVKMVVVKQGIGECNYIHIRQCEGGLWT